GGPAGGVRRRVDEQRLRGGRDRGGELLDVAGPAIAGPVERYRNRLRAGYRRRRVEVRPGRREIDDLVARARDRIERKLDRLHAGDGDDELLSLEGLAEVPPVIARQRLAQLGNAALPGVEGLACLQRLRCCGGDEAGRRQIALTRPERQQAVPAP